MEFNFKNLKHLVLKIENIQGPVFVENIPNHKKLVEEAGKAHGATSSSLVVFADLDPCGHSQLNVIKSGVDKEIHYTLLVGYVENSRDAHFKLMSRQEK